ncbi:MAG: hypothetical protein Q9217_005172 [Psora testacea]
MADNHITSEWASSVSNAVVTIHVAVPYPFDTKSPGTLQGTGFVVDKINGLILTNRHLVGDEPLTARAVFECGYNQDIVRPVYVDPCHDFAFVKYNVGPLTSKVEEIPIRPDLARVGLDIRVLGNNDGEVLSFHQGVISRVNRNPPELHGFWDIMTNYIQGSSDTVGGSSGSPVVDKHGNAVGMLSGGGFTASIDFYLDLTLPLRVLKSLQSGKCIYRGTIQSSWMLQDPATCAARGISREIINNSDSTGLLVAHRVIPEGPSDGQIQEGDVLLDVEGEKIESLVHFEHLLDRRVGDKITIRRLRQGQDGQAEVLVQDLFKITPFRLLQFAGAMFHDVRLQVALKWNLPINGVYLPEAIGCFDEISGVIHSVDGQPTPNLVTFMDVVRKIYHGKKIAVGFQPVSATQTSHKTVTLFPPWPNTNAKLWTRDSGYFWTDSDLWVTQVDRAPSSEVMHTNQSDESFDAKEKNTASLVRVKTYNQLDNTVVFRDEYEFDGLVINVSEGFVLISKANCLSIMCTIMVIVEDEEIPAKIVYDHALNVVVIQFDSSHVECKLRNATFGQGVLKENDLTKIYGRWGRKVEATVRCIEPMSGSANPSQPPMNAEVIRLNASNPPAFGVLVDDDGDAVALWLPIWSNGEMKSVGISVHLVMPIIKSLQQGILPVECRTLAASFRKIDKVAARTFGVPQEILPQFEERGLYQARQVAITSSETGLLAGDVVLYINGKPVKRLWDLAPAVFLRESLLMTVIRGAEQKSLNVPTFTTSQWHCKSSIWCLGAKIDTPDFSTAMITRSLYSQLFVTEIAPGSPAQEFKVPPRHFITHVNGKATKDIETFIKEIEAIREHTWCQLTLVGTDGVSTSTAVLSNRFFKNKLAQRKDSMPYQWERLEI